MARVKGLTEKEFKNNSKLVMQILELTEYYDVLAKNLSLSNRRKLQLAMSVIVRPTVEYIDEAFDGVDPCALRGLHKMIKELKVLESSVLLTTKSMQEAEQLCDKIAIIINGKVVAYGSPNYLAQSYGGGYEVSTVVEITKADYLEAYKVITERFNGSVSLVF